MICNFRILYNICKYDDPMLLDKFRKRLLLYLCTFFLWLVARWHVPCSISVGWAISSLKLDQWLFHIRQRYCHIILSQFSILSPLNVINRFTLKYRWYLLSQRKMHDNVDFAKKKVIIFGAPRLHIYRTMIANIFVPALHGIDVNDAWFQQDSVTCHTSGISNESFLPYS